MRREKKMRSRTISTKHLPPFPKGEGGGEEKEKGRIIGLVIRFISSQSGGGGKKEREKGKGAVRLQPATNKGRKKEKKRGEEGVSHLA